MPTCCICKEGYARQTHWEPAEHCECGADWNGEGAEPGEILTRRNEWLRAQAEAELPRCPTCGSTDWLYQGDRQVCADCGK